MHKLDHPNKEKIIEAILGKQKWIWIEAEYNCGSGTITRYRKQLGLETPPPKLTPEDRQRIIALRKNKKLTELAAMFKVSQQRISTICSGVKSSPYPLQRGTNSQ